MKKIIIGTPSLGSGGVEVSLVRFLNELSKNKELEITLLLLEKKGIYLKDIPENIKIEEVTYQEEYYSFNKSIKDIKNIKKLKDKILFFRYRNKLRKYQNKNDFKNYYDLIISKTNIPLLEYDLAIDFHGYGHFMSVVIANIKASKRVMWIHDEKNEWLNKVLEWLNKYDKLFCVSNSCKDIVTKKFPFLSKKLDVFYNLIDYQNIRMKAKEKMEIKFSNEVLNLVTVGRLEWQKGYDIAIDTAYLLKQKNLKFKWYIIGGGTALEELKQKVKEKDLVNDFIFLGIKKNPFPYMKNADIYVQTSRHEGYGLAIAEARVLETIPIATKLNCIKEQIWDGVNGFLCELNPDDFASKIIMISKDNELVNKIKENLSKENFDFTSEFEKLYKLLDN